MVNIRVEKVMDWPTSMMLSYSESQQACGYSSKHLHRTFQWGYISLTEACGSLMEESVTICFLGYFLLQFQLIFMLVITF